MGEREGLTGADRSTSGSPPDPISELLDRLRRTTNYKPSLPRLESAKQASDLGLTEILDYLCPEPVLDRVQLGFHYQRTAACHQKSFRELRPPPASFALNEKIEALGAVSPLSVATVTFQPGDFVRLHPDIQRQAAEIDAQQVIFSRVNGSVSVALCTDGGIIPVIMQADRQQLAALLVPTNAEQIASDTEALNKLRQAAYTTATRQLNFTPENFSLLAGDATAKKLVELGALNITISSQGSAEQVKIVLPPESSVEIGYGLSLHCLEEVKLRLLVTQHEITISQIEGLQIGLSSYGPYITPEEITLSSDGNMKSTIPLLPDITRQIGTQSFEQASTQFSEFFNYRTALGQKASKEAALEFVQSHPALLQATKIQELAAAAPAPLPSRIDR